MQLFKDFIKNYKQGYSGYRPDIVKCLPDLPANAKILDVGCGEGFLKQEFVSRGLDVQVYGIEFDAKLAKEAKARLDGVAVGDSQQSATFANLPIKRFDVIIMADVLEHIYDPLAVLKNAINYLAPDGVVITSIPNIRHYSTFVRLFIFGDWPRNERGIHDKTHIRQFAKKNILALLSDAGLLVIKEKRNCRLIETLSWTNPLGKLFDFWPFRAFLTFQYIHLCKLKSR